jgi:hypothetical protein
MRDPEDCHNDTLGEVEMRVRQPPLRFERLDAG